MMEMFSGCSSIPFRSGVLGIIRHARLLRWSALHVIDLQKRYNTRPLKLSSVPRSALHDVPSRVNDWTLAYLEPCWPLANRLSSCAAAVRATSANPLRSVCLCVCCCCCCRCLPRQRGFSHNLVLTTAGERTPSTATTTRRTTTTLRRIGLIKTSWTSTEGTITSNKINFADWLSKREWEAGGYLIGLDYSWAASIGSWIKKKKEERGRSFKLASSWRKKKLGWSEISKSFLFAN